MKKIFYAALLTISLTTTAFAKDANKISARIMRTFNFEFAEAENVNWKATKTFVKASFELDGEKREVFYDLTGEMIGTSKSITLNELPVFAKRAFAKKYEGYTVNEAIRFEGADESAYYISAENDKESVVLKVAENRVLSVYKRDRKY
jgi:uncharacterized DUF497 family protein